MSYPNEDEVALAWLMDRAVAVLGVVALVVVAVFLMLAAADAAPGRPVKPGLPKPPVISRPIPGLPGQPIRRFAENWQEILCVFVAYSVSPTLPPATQKLYLGNCPDRSYYQPQVGQLPLR